MSHKDNKNSKANKKAGKKTKAELKKMKEETSNEVGFSNESRKLGKDGDRSRKIKDPRS
ncbi:hypothetical protein BJV85_001591 [Clostridium acetobutylicum]|nr:MULTISPECIES: hypothetical protein [Clostridium]ADZ21344.1 Conserved hypothetical protein [Clostridium acetobutylicum EA 2018]AWV79328.1 small, acid-soluble spore protein, alpha/beta type [Clostridium acetobutylicum]MBC2394701.1 small, acid-soluble spore protein, alpha/beta type [Clostridium acetobutylicum]MBC2585660.1 small, acid-soluble spore protein, alpha/beta type [Clostridium acetobutylicum]NOV88626.1 hypothetical protein [Clostridium acetobutylicum]